MQKQKNKTFVLRLMSLFVIVLVISASAILRDSKLLGHDMGEALATSAAVAVDNDTLEVLPDGAIVVNTRLLAKDVQGYGGPVALRIHIDKGGVVDNIEAEPNAETPDFFNHAKSVMARWQGKTVDEAMAEQVDAVTGATFSSRAIIENVHRGLAYAKQYNASDATDSADVQVDAYLAKGWTIGGVAALIVVLLGAVVPLLFNNRRWHNVQLVLNVVVLGLWTGTFVSYTLLMRLFAGGVSIASLGVLAAPLLTVVVAMFYPLAGKPGHYCAHLCPFGSAQELAGKLSRRKLHITSRLNKRLSIFRNVLWGVLMALMLTGTWTAWMDYELFTAFLYTSASAWVIAFALLFIVLSVWVPRPYCRYVCPTGCLFRS